MINEGINGETQTLLECFGFLYKNSYETMDVLPQMARDTSKFKKTICVSEIPFFKSCAFHASSFYE